MEIEKTLTVAAPPAQVWQMLLDPTIMAAAVPGMQSIEVHSPTEYSAVIAQKIAFISAKFKLHTRIVEQRPPEYLRAEGTGEDTSVASSLKQTSEVFLSPSPDGGTALRIKVNVELLGRLGSFGLAAMKTKADRLWEEFGANLARSIEAGAAASSPAAVVSANPTLNPSGNSLDGLPPPPLPPSSRQAAAVPAATATAAPVASAAPAISPANAHTNASTSISAEPVVSSPPGLLARLFGKGQTQVVQASAAAKVIRVELRQREQTLHVEWPAEQAQECHAWLSTVLAQDSKA